MIFLLIGVVPAVGAYNLLIDRRYGAASTPDLLGWLAITVVSGAIACSGIPLLNGLRRAGWPVAQRRLVNWIVFYGIFLLVFLVGAALRSVVAPLVLPHQPLPPGQRFVLALNLTVIYLFLLIGLEYTAGRQEAQLSLQAERRAVMAQLAESRSQLVATEDRQHKHLAEYLHGKVQTRLLVAWALIGQAKECRGRDRPESIRLLQESRQHLAWVRRATMPEVRELLGASEIEAPLEVVVSWVVDRFSAVIPVEFELAGDAVAPMKLEPAARLAAIRMLEEALQNVLRHARAHRVRVRVVRAPGELRIRIEDDGRGFDPASVERGVGLAGLAKSLAESGGSCHVESSPRNGSMVTIRVPALHEAVPAVERGACS